MNMVTVSTGHRNQTTISSSFLLFLLQVEEHVPVYHKASVIDMHFLKKIETYAGTNSYYYRYIFKVALHFPDTDFWLI